MRWSFSLLTCCVRDDEREAERKIHMRECLKNRSVEKGGDKDNF